MRKNLLMILALPAVMFWPAIGDISVAPYVVSPVVMTSHMAPAAGWWDDGQLAAPGGARQYMSRYWTTVPMATVQFPDGPCHSDLFGAGTFVISLNDMMDYGDGTGGVPFYEGHCAETIAPDTRPKRFIHAGDLGKVVLTTTQGGYDDELDANGQYTATGTFNLPVGDVLYFNNATVTSTMTTGNIIGFSGYNVVLGPGKIAGTGPASADSGANAFFVYGPAVFINNLYIDGVCDPVLNQSGKQGCTLRQVTTGPNCWGYPLWGGPSFDVCVLGCHFAPSKGQDEIRFGNEYSAEITIANCVMSNAIKSGIVFQWVKDFGVYKTETDSAVAANGASSGCPNGIAPLCLLPGQTRTAGQITDGQAESVSYGQIKGGSGTGHWQFSGGSSHIFFEGFHGTGQLAFSFENCNIGAEYALAGPPKTISDVLITNSWLATTRPDASYMTAGPTPVYPLTTAGGDVPNLVDGVAFKNCGMIDPYLSPSMSGPSGVAIVIQPQTRPSTQPSTTSGFTFDGDNWPRGASGRFAGSAAFYGNSQSSLAWRTPVAFAALIAPGVDTFTMVLPVTPATWAAQLAFARPGDTLQLKGKFNFTSTQTIPDGLSLEGPATITGTTPTTIPSNHDSVPQTFQVNGGSGAEFKNLTFDGASIKLQAVSDATVTACTFVGGFRDIFAVGCPDLTVTDNTMSGSTDTAIYQYGPAIGQNISGNTFADDYEPVGIFNNAAPAGAEPNVIANNTITEARRIGLEIDGADAVWTITGNTIGAFPANLPPNHIGISLVCPGQTGLTVSDNVIDGLNSPAPLFPGTSAIEIVGASATVSGNSLGDCGTGILSGVTQSLISADNRFHDIPPAHWYGVDGGPPATQPTTSGNTSY